VALTVVALVALAVALVLTPVAATVASRLGVVDHPGPLKVHTRPVPYLGGLAVLGALAAGAGWRVGLWLLPVGLACGLGLADDITDLDARVRLGAEAAIGALAGGLIAGGSFLGVVVGAGVVALLVNTVNLLDGLDGLAAGVCLASAIGFAVLGRGRAQFLAIGLAGALAGFLVYNRPPARIYLGDAGSYLLGASLGTLLIASWAHAHGHTSAAIAAVLLVGVPVADTSLAVLRRYRSGRPLFTGDRSHIYDQLVSRGWSASRASGTCVLAQALLVGVALSVFRAPVVVAAIVVAGTIGAVAVLLFAAGFAAPTKESAP
jgi:UDP-N-acetylmuramyl pentapeptide phosphotransferase/UDP-N-acetylglucosamine-1-phosphate transferase